MVVTQKNLTHIRSTAADLAKMGVKRFSTTPASLNVEHPNQSDLLDREQVVTMLEDLDWCHEYLGLTVDVLEAIPKCIFPSWFREKEYALLRRSCQAGINSMTLSNNGDIRPCSHNPNIYGNLLDESLEEIWKKMHVVYRQGLIPTDCSCCAAVSTCRGACRTNSLALTGELNAPDRLMCQPIDKLVKKLPEITIENGSALRFNGKLRWRKEIGSYSVSTKVRNIMEVNDEMFRFIQWLESALPRTVEELMKEGSHDSNLADLIRVLKNLVRKEFLSVI